MHIDTFVSPTAHRGNPMSTTTMLENDRTLPKSPMQKALDSHIAALAASKGTTADDEAFDAAVDAEVLAMRALATSRCKSNDEFFVKASYILEYGLGGVSGRDPRGHTFGDLAIALETYLGQRNTPDSDAIAPQRTDSYQDAYRELDDDIGDLALILRGADHLQLIGEERSARVIFEKAAEMAENLDQKYQRDLEQLMKAHSEEARQ
jgi:hypothetical protein